MKLIFVLTLAVALLATSAVAQKSAGAPFGARDPRNCDSFQQPEKGGPTAEQLTQYFICDSEFVNKPNTPNALLYLVSDVKIEVGKGRHFDPVTDQYPDLDARQLVYPVTGSFVSWSCFPLTSPGITAGKNCAKMDQPHAGGLCFKNSLAEWHCKLFDNTITNYGRDRFPPPGK